MSSETDNAIAGAINPLNQKIRDLERRVADLEKQIKRDEKAFSDLVKKLDPRNR